MLRPTQSKKQNAAGLRFAIIASKYNARYVDSMLAAAEKALLAAEAREVKVVRVPGAFEIPSVASALARRSRNPFSAIICLGVILRGETTHANHIAEAVSHALAQLQVQFQKPVIHEVLLLENENQAKVRCLDPRHNRGLEAALTALEMAQVMTRLWDEKQGLIKDASPISQRLSAKSTAENE